MLPLWVKPEPASGGTLYLPRGWSTTIFAMFHQILHKRCRDRTRSSKSSLSLYSLLRLNLVFILTLSLTLAVAAKYFWRKTRPLLLFHGNKAILNFSRPSLIGSQTNSGAGDTGNLTAIQDDALLLVQETASRRCVPLIPRNENTIFVNNLAVLRSRAGSTDDLTN
ncbi:hypothetical protein VUR80DRAFT_6643 [Thermomyces stellatus]